MKKIYYSIGEVSELTSVEPHVLRYWETVFKELNPKKNKAGNRTYRNKDIEIILKIRELVQEKKYSTAGAQRALREQKNNDDRIALPVSIKKDLKEIRMFLEKLHDAL